MYGIGGVIARFAVSSLIDTFSENDFFNVLYVSFERCYFKKARYINSKKVFIWRQNISLYMYHVHRHM